MNNLTFLLLTGAIGIGILIALAKYWQAKLFVKYSIESTNTAYSIYLGAQLISFGILYSALIEPLMVSNTMLISIDQNTASMEALKLAGIFIAIVIMIYIFLTATNNFIYKYLSKSENGVFEEIRENKISVSISVALTLISMVMIFYSLIGKILSEFIPYPELPRFF